MSNLSQIDKTKNKYNHINSNGTVTIVTGKAWLHSINVGDSGTSWRVRVFDAAGTEDNIIFDANVAVEGSTHIFNIEANTGLTVVTTGSAAGSITVSYTDGNA